MLDKGDINKEAKT